MKPAKHSLINCLLTCFATLAVGADQTATAPAPVNYGGGVVVTELADKSINESSGVAVSHFAADVFWTHNDSGDRPRFFAFNRKGEVLGDFTVDRAGAVDWEDMASYTLDGKNYLLGADVGDNASRRASCMLYFVLEPQPPAKPAGAATVALAAREEFTFEDGPHNCESVAVDTARREVILISKCDGNNCKAYVLPLPLSGAGAAVKDVKDSKNLVAKAIASLTIPTATGMDISPDGLRAVVVTYGDAWEYARRADEDWATGFARARRQIKLPPRRQGESICYGRDGVTLYLTSEGVPCPLIEVTPAR